MQIQALIRITVCNTLRYQCFNPSVVLLNYVLYGVVKMLALVSYLLVKTTKLQFKYGLFIIGNWSFFWLSGKSILPQLKEDRSSVGGKVCLDKLYDRVFMTCK